MEVKDLMPLAVMLIPIIAIGGGIIHGIVRTVGQQRLAELAQRERIAAIERGIDPRTLPPILPPSMCPPDMAMTFEQRQLRTSQGLLIGGFITAAVGFALFIPFLVLDNQEGWIPGLVLSCVGIALLISARIVRLRNGTRIS